MKRAALGFRAHSGWTAVVALCLEKNEPRVLARQRPQLVEKFTYKLRQPYHTAGKMPLDKAREFVTQIEATATRLAEEAIRNVQAERRPQGYELTCFGLPMASARPLPDLEKILASHALVHTADGELFRRALIVAGERCQMTAFTLAERELVTTACQKLKIAKDGLLSRVTALGKPFGPPGRKTKNSPPSPHGWYLPCRDSRLGCPRSEAPLVDGDTLMFPAEVGSPETPARRCCRRIPGS